MILFFKSDRSVKSGPVNKPGWHKVEISTTLHIHEVEVILWQILGAIWILHLSFIAVMFCRPVTSLMCWLNHNIRCSHRPGWQTLINTKVVSVDYPGVTVCEDLVANRLCLHFCRKASWKFNSSSHLILAYISCVTSIRQYMETLNQFYRDNLAIEVREWKDKPQSQCSNQQCCEKFPVPVSGTSCMSGFSCLLMGDLSPAFLPDLHNYSKVVTTASLLSGSGALLEPRVIFQPSLALFTSGLSLHHHFLFRTIVSLLVCLCQVFTKKISNSNQTEETSCYHRDAATKR